MDKCRVVGIDLTVAMASDENGYIELTPEAEQNSWAMIGNSITTYIATVTDLLCFFI